ncbi:hypothetical protein DVR12_17980 [Chitinophaga silvatica]|uniref:Uncharacterized protein n=1 Tax=Chitinophaga silvatica TaxID=2282649 RepID=A0A3E1Y6A0_9BACT|nr:hypothetical protein [Chitinophaga silvatica]RFS20460.1 hypothetical protein DVR12_17980 [Chitinophaga silvatica]
MPNIGQQKARITRLASNINDWKLDGNKAGVIASIRFVQHTYQCFSDWSKQDMKVFWTFIEKLHRYNWQDLLNTGGKHNKTGLAPTIIPRSKYPDCDFKAGLTEDVQLFELRIDHTKRVHGFRVDALFYICWLDKNHVICQ